MWFLLFLSCLNAALDQEGIVLKQRVSIGGLPINILDGMLILGSLIGFVGLMSDRKRFRTEHAHPLFIATSVLFVLTVIAGMIGAMRGHLTTYALANELRNVTALPLSIVAGYYFLKRPASTRGFPYVHIIAGILSAGLIVFFFLGRSADEIGQHESINNIRVVQFVSNYAGLAAALLLYTLLDRKSRLLPAPLAIVVMGFCLAGQFGTLSRSDWCATIAAFFSLVFLFPRGQRLRKVFMFVLAIPVLVGCLWIGAMVVSKVSQSDATASLRDRVNSLLPGRGDDRVSRSKAWDTRLPGILAELRLWLDSPLIGNGFALASARDYGFGDNVAFNHNVWSSTLAKTGLIGFAAYLTPVLGLIVVGGRMVRKNSDKGTTLMGIIGVTTGAYMLVLGGTTMCFNTQRSALVLGLLCGVVLRARAMQLTIIRQYEGYVDFGRQDGFALSSDETDYSPDFEGYIGTQIAGS